MSQLDSELDRLRLRMVALEEQKQKEAEIALEKKSFPLKALENLVDNHKNVRSGGSNKFQNERWRDAQIKLSFLEPILDALKNINERLEALERN